MGGRFVGKEQPGRIGKRPRVEGAIGGIAFGIVCASLAKLVFDIFWRGMAVTIMAGLTFATVLTLIVVPVLYATFYRVASPEMERAS